MGKLPIIYYSHPMELDNNGLIVGSGKRAFDMKVMLQGICDMWIPEENQSINHDKQQKIDLDALLKCDILVVDLYHFGLLIDGKPIWGRGTNQEVGFIKCANKLRQKKVPIVQIIRSEKHPFVKEGSYEDYGVTKNCVSLVEAIDWIKKHYEKKN